VIIAGRILQEVEEVLTSLVEQTNKMGLETDEKRQNTTNIFHIEIKSLKLVREWMTAGIGHVTLPAILRVLASTFSLCFVYFYKCYP
jgi:hypothetical protein